MSGSVAFAAVLAGIAVVLGAATVRTVRLQGSARSASARLLRSSVDVAGVTDAAADTGGAETWFGRALASIAPGQNPERVATVAVLVGAIALGCLAVAAPVGTAVAAGVVAGLGAIGRHWLQRRPPSTTAYEADLLSCLGHVQAALSSGSSLTQAWTAAAGARSRGPCASDLALLGRNLHGGGRAQTALDAWATLRPGSGVPLVADALAIAGTTGASQAAAVEAVAATLRRRQAQAREVRALASQARASAMVLVGLPLGFAVLVSLLDRRVGTFLVTTAAGWACLIGGLALDAAGAAWMAALVRRVR